MKAWRVHYLNKYPGCQIKDSDSSFDVYTPDGQHLLSLVKNGAGQWVDRSEELGLPERHDLSPIPRESRVHKLHQDGKIGLDEQAQSRKSARREFARGGKIASMKELEGEGYRFDGKGNAVEKPKPEVREIPEASEPQTPSAE